MKDLLLNAHNWQSSHYSRDWESCNFLTQCSVIRPVLAGTAVKRFKYGNNCVGNAPLSSTSAFFHGRLFALCWHAWSQRISSAMKIFCKFPLFSVKDRNGPKKGILKLWCDSAATATITDRAALLRVPIEWLYRQITPISNVDLLMYRTYCSPFN